MHQTVQAVLLFTFTCLVSVHVLCKYLAKALVAIPSIIPIEVFGHFFFSSALEFLFADTVGLDCIATLKFDFSGSTRVTAV